MRIKRSLYFFLIIVIFFQKKRLASLQAFFKYGGA